ncbi:MAG: permease [Bacilli bacterium]|nr:permease [Bacilli bacterium]
MVHTGVVITSRMEWEELLKIYNIVQSKIEKYPYGEYFIINIYNNDVLFYRCAGRKVTAAASTQYMIDKFSLQKVVHIGSATAVSDKVEYGDIIIPTLVAEYDLTIKEIEPLIKESTVIELDPVRVSMDYLDGLLGTSDKSLVTKNDYMMVKETSMLASDTESAAIAKVCKINDIDIIIIKGISDRPSTNGKYEEQYDVYEEYAPIIIKNIVEDYLLEVI